MEPLILTTVIVLILFSLLILFFSRYKKCPSDKIMVVYGNVGKNSEGAARSAKCIHGGAAFVWPIVQSYEFMSLTPISIEVALRNALSKQNIRIENHFNEYGANINVAKSKGENIIVFVCRHENEAIVKY